METRETQTSERRYALLVQGDFFWLFGQVAEVLTITVRRGAHQSEMISEKCRDEEAAAAKFDYMLAHSRRHRWTPLYAGPRLDG